MKTILIVSIFFFSVNCATLDESVYKSKIYCQELMNSKGLTQKDNEKWNKRYYIDCVSDMTKASESSRVADNTAAIWSIWIVTIIINTITTLARLTI